MRRLVSSIILLFACLFLFQAVFAAQGRPHRLVVTHATIVDVQTGKLLTDHNVIIVGDRIQSVEAGNSAGVREDDTIVDARGKYLIPGLWDCHIHLSLTSESALPLLLALGITDVRDLGGKLTEIEGWRARIDEGTLPDLALCAWVQF